MEPTSAIMEIFADTEEAVISSFSLSGFINGWLQSTDIPGNAVWTDAVLHLGAHLPLDSISKPFFRPRMLVWAATGSLELKPEIVAHSQHIVVSVSFLTCSYLT